MGCCDCLSSVVFEILPSERWGSSRLAQDREPSRTGKSIFEALKLFAGLSHGLRQAKTPGKGGEEIFEKNLSDLFGNGFSHNDHVLKGQIAEGVDQAKAVAGVKDGELETLLAGTLESVFEFVKGEAIGGIDA